MRITFVLVHLFASPYRRLNYSSSLVVPHRKEILAEKIRFHLKINTKQVRVLQIQNLHLKS